MGRFVTGGRHQGVLLIRDWYRSLSQSLLRKRRSSASRLRENLRLLTEEKLCITRFARLRPSAINLFLRD
jgi:hypothetical protein